VVQTPELLVHDLDGNLVRDGRWVYSWDAENRLVRLMSWGNLDRRRVDWTYDALGRRVRQVRYVWTNSTWQVVEDLKLVGDPVMFGRHIAELNGTNGAVVRSYVWGLDVSESLDGAGGVGGLLWVRLSGGPAAGVHFVTYDGNGNVWNLVSASTGTETARYEYGPFGEPLRLTGVAAGSNPFRFSTKRTEDGTGLVLYEYRAYSPTSGRWLSRDLIGGKRGENLYANCRNDVVKYVDWLGLWRIERKGQARALAYAEDGDTIRRLEDIISLNRREWTKWLTPEKVYTRQYNLDTPLTSCDTFSVPNTAYIDVSAYTWGYMRLWVFRYRLELQRRWSEAGYRVDYSYYSVTKDLILAHLNDPDLYAYAYIGHGAAGYLILGQDEADWIARGTYTPFGIVEMHLIGCYTNDGVESWKKNVAKEGILVTVEGELNSWNQDLRTHAGE